MLTILQGDCLQVLRTLHDESVHCCVTSPPYWGLRDYGVDGQIGLEKTPEEYVAKIIEVFREVRRVLRADGTCWVNLGSSYAGSGQGGNPLDSPFQKQKSNRGSFSYEKRPTRSHSDALACGNDGTGLQDSFAPGRVCPDCGGELTACSLNHRDRNARISLLPEQSGQQPLPIIHGSGHLDCAPSSPVSSETAVQQSTISSCNPNGQGALFQEDQASVSRSEAETLLDNARESERKSVCTSGTSQNARPSVLRNQDRAFVCMACGYSTRMFPDFKPKDMVPIPWMVAMALQRDGWWLRQDIIWQKPNPMPESVTDRCTKAHEYLFLLAKSERYFYDAEAIREPQSQTTFDRFKNGCTRKPSKKHIGTEGECLAGHDTETAILENGRNKRSVWTVPSSAYPESHFATFPPDLIKPCILAGTSARGCCPKCGSPWERVTQDSAEYAAFKESESFRKNGGMRSSTLETNGLTRGTGNKSVSAQRETLGWQPPCQHGEDPSEVHMPIPCTVLDPFGGSGTTGQVSLELGRKAILIELNPEYVKLAEQRCNVTPGLPLA